ncbi:MAG: hypothetical protein ABSA92_16220 [Candidatus Bathyarchaeia archaeon]|jgi:hypothetical protein
MSVLNQGKRLAKSDHKSKKCLAKCARRSRTADHQNNEKVNQQRETVKGATIEG